MPRSVNRVIYVAHFIYYLRVHRSVSMAFSRMAREGEAWRTL
ncbi:hypothetical protein [Variovorax paradoxus]